MISGNKKSEYLFTFLVTGALGLIGFKQSLLIESVIKLSKETKQLALEKPVKILESNPSSQIQRFADESYCGMAPAGRVIVNFKNADRSMLVKIKNFCNKKRKTLLSKGAFWTNGGNFFFQLKGVSDEGVIKAVKRFTYDSNGIVKTFDVHDYTYSKALCFDSKFNCKK